MRRLLYENSLSLVMFGLFMFSFIGQTIAGELVYNQDQEAHSQPTVSYTEYLTTGHFIEAVFENWESEFLQMGAYVLFTVFLRQKGSSESKKLDGEEAVDADPRLSQDDPNAPWPVRQGGWVLKLYENSLTISLLLLFVLSFTLHAIGGTQAYCQEQLEHREACITALEYAVSPQFWFESFQNWQSEFLSVGALVVLSVFLRQKGSPESKPVASPHAETGSE